MAIDKVTTPAVTDDSITAAKINNDIISGSTELAAEPADTDEFLVSDAGTLKRVDYSHIKGGGCWEKLDTITISGTVSQIEHEEANFTSTHRDYKIMFSGLTSTTDNALYMRIAGDGATLLSTSDYTYAVTAYKDNNATNSQYSSSADKFYIGGTYTGTGGSYTSNFEINLYNPLSTSTYMTWSGTGMQTDDGDKTMTFTGAGQYVAADSTAMKRFVFYRGSGDFNNGVITLYGRTA